MLKSMEQAKLCQIIRLGCSRATAAKYMGLAPERFAEEIAGDETLAREVLRAEADAVLRHMGNVHKAASDEKNWRTSVWWLEQQTRIDAQLHEAMVGVPEMMFEALERFAELIVDEIPDASRRQSLLTKLLSIAGESTGRFARSTVVDVKPTLLNREALDDDEEETSP